MSKTTVKNKDLTPQWWRQKLPELEHADAYLDYVRGRNNGTDHVVYGESESGEPIQPAEDWQSVYEAHYNQTVASASAIRQRYQNKVAFGELAPVDLVWMLNDCYDTTDAKLVGTSQFGHCCQIYRGMQLDGVDDPRLLASAFLHDVGKVMELTGELPENVYCMNNLLAVGDRSDLLSDALVQHFNHDEFAFLKLQPYLAQERGMLFVLRFHSLNWPDHFDLLETMSPRDREGFEFVCRFVEYDQNTKKERDTQTRVSRNEVAEVLRPFLPETIVV